jgi:predicted AlkP superfamily phosphohydrolase/phosphomutase
MNKELLKNRVTKYFNQSVQLDALHHTALDRMRDLTELYDTLMNRVVIAAVLDSHDEPDKVIGQWLESMGFTLGDTEASVTALYASVSQELVRQLNAWWEEKGYFTIDTSVLGGNLFIMYHLEDGETV